MEETEGPAAGASSSSRNCTSGGTSSSRTSLDGDANGCPGLPETAYFPLAPDWVCEVLSPSTVRLDREKKLRIYAEHSVAHAWLVDPIARTLEVLRNEDGAWTLLTTHTGDVTARIEPFEAIEVRLGRLWAE